MIIRKNTRFHVIPHATEKSEQRPMCSQLRAWNNYQISSERLALCHFLNHFYYLKLTSELFERSTKK